MLGYGLTGNIGSGKSTVGKIFAECGWHVLDADRLGHEVFLEPWVKEQIRSMFPDCVVEETVDRRRLASLVFANPQWRRQLEELVHPIIWQRTLELTKGDNRPFILEGAVLLESPLPFRELLAGLILVTAPWTIRQRRVMERDGCTAQEVRTRTSHQWPQEEKILKADFVIDNGGELEHTRQQVLAISQLLAGEWGGKQ